MNSLQGFEALKILKELSFPFNDSEHSRQFAAYLSLASVELSIIDNKNQPENKIDYKEFRREVALFQSYKEIFKEIESIKINHKLKEKTKTIKNKVVIQVIFESLFESIDWSGYLEKTKNDLKFKTHRGNQLDEVKEVCKKFALKISKYIDENLKNSFNSINSKHEFICTLINILRTHHKLKEYETSFVTKLLKP